MNKSIKNGRILGLNFTINDNDEVEDIYNGASFNIYDILVNFLNMELDTYEKLNNDIKLLPKEVFGLSQTEYIRFRLYDLIDNYLVIFSESFIFEIPNEDFEDLLSTYDLEDPKLYRPFNFKELQGFQKDLQDNLLITNEFYLGNMDIKLNYDKGVVTEHYLITDIVTFIIFSISRLNKANKIIKKCENCGDYFIPSTKNEIYCDKVFPNGRTCKLMGYENKIKRDDNQITYEYRKAYKNHNAVKNRTKHTGPKAEERWNTWKVSAKEKLSECKNGIITLDEFKEWLNKE